MSNADGRLAGERKQLPRVAYTPVNGKNSEKCGAFNCRPDALQGCANIRAFTAAISIWTLIVSIHFAYCTAILTQIEKAFGLSSRMVGLIKNIDNIGYVIAVIIISQLCRYSNKPRMFAIASVFNAIAVGMFALPHFIYDNPFEISRDDDVSHHMEGNQSVTEDNLMLCLAPIDGEPRRSPDCEHDGDWGDLYNGGAACIFIISSIAQGMAGSPKFSMTLTYMDDNDSKKSPLYFAFLFSAKALSPLIGFSLGAFTNNIYVDLTDPGISTDDPRFIGAWWLGFLICAVVNLLVAFPISLFPADVKTKKQKMAEEEIPEAGETDDTKPAEQNALGDFKDLPSALYRILSDPIYCVLVIGSCLELYMFGFLAFTPKYLQLEFGVSAARASVYTGITVAVALCTGPVLSGIITTRANVGVRSSLKLIVAVSITNTIGILILTFFSCPDTWAGDLGPDRVFVNETCNSNCQCDVNRFLPVCGDDGRSYFSACYAGCTTESFNETMQMYTECSCVPGGTAIKGKCEKSCPLQFFPYMAILCIVKFVTAMDLVPKMNVILRNTTKKDKALSVALFGAIMMLLGMPAPIAFGMVIDSSCVTDLAPCARKGACLLYDMDAFRIRVHSFALVLKVLALSLYCSAYVIEVCRTRRRVGDQGGGHSILPTEDCDQKEQKEPDMDSNNNDVTKSNHVIWDEQIVKKILEEKGVELNETTI